MQTTNRPSRGATKFSRRRSFSSSKPHRGSFTGSRSRSAGGRRFGGAPTRSRGGRKMATFDPSRFININPMEEVTEVYTPKNTFSTFGLNKKLVETVHALGIETPTPIQDQIIPEILKGNDAVGLAETGTGKTAAFLLPLIEKTLKEHQRQTLILAPTRELAIQIQEELRSLTRGFRIFSTVCVGGVNIRQQIMGLRRPNQFIIGTPGRILDLIKRGHFKPEHTTTVVLDEADRMLDMGFIADMKEILSTTPKEKETLFFSATMSPATSALVIDFLKNPVTISVKKKDVTNSIEQDVVRYSKMGKFETLTSLFESPELSRVIIFGSMKHSVQKLAEQLNKEGISAESIHGNKSHGQRQQALKRFKAGSVRVLVATDVAARGIHVEDVSHVINYDLPNTFEDYVHRIGRTGRNFKKGKALTFISK